MWRFALGEPMEALDLATPIPQKQNQGRGLKIGCSWAYLSRSPPQFHEATYPPDAHQREVREGTKPERPGFKVSWYQVRQKAYTESRRRYMWHERLHAHCEVCHLPHLVPRKSGRQLENFFLEKPRNPRGNASRHLEAPNKMAQSPLYH